MNARIFVSAMLLLLIAYSCQNDDEFVPETDAIYEVSLLLNWNEVDFPMDYPTGAHFSRLVSWSHDKTVLHFQEGDLASEGMEQMAERGRTTPLDTEIMALITNNQALDFQIGDWLRTGVGELKDTLAVTDVYSSISLTTMIAPSPDWFVAAVNVDTYANGRFMDDIIMPAMVFDSGTDDGITFRSTNEDSVPQQVITLLTNSPLGDASDLASFQFRRIDN